MRTRNITIISLALGYMAIAVFIASNLGGLYSENNAVADEQVLARAENSRTLEEKGGIESKVSIVDIEEFSEPVKINELFDNQENTKVAVVERQIDDRYGLQDLFVLDRLFEEGAILNSNATTLGDLFILDRLFRDSSFGLLEEEGLSLGELFVLDELFNGNAILDPGSTTLSDLFILDKLFNK